MNWNKFHTRLFSPLHLALLIAVSFKFQSEFYMAPVNRL
jgi:hypothetical protein